MSDDSTRPVRASSAAADDSFLVIHEHLLQGRGEGGAHMDQLNITLLLILAILRQTRR